MRNLVILLRHDLLCGDYAAAADALTTLMPERRMIPDVVFKTCLQVCDSVLYIFHPAALRSGLQKGLIGDLRIYRSNILIRFFFLLRKLKIKQKMNKRHLCRCSAAGRRRRRYCALDS